MRSQSDLSNTRERVVSELQAIVSEMTQKQNELQQLNAVLVDLSVKRVQMEAQLNTLDYALSDDPVIPVPTKED